MVAIVIFKGREMLAYLVFDLIVIVLVALRSIYQLTRRMLIQLHICETCDWEALWNLFPTMRGNREFSIVSMPPKPVYVTNEDGEVLYREFVGETFWYVIRDVGTPEVLVYNLEDKRRRFCGKIGFDPNIFQITERSFVPISV